MSCNGKSTWNKGKQHNEETRRKISEAAKYKSAREREEKANNGYRMLIGAIVRQAIKDGAEWFLESGAGKNFCAVAGINPDSMGVKKALSIHRQGIT